MPTYRVRLHSKTGRVIYPAKVIELEAADATEAQQEAEKLPLPKRVVAVSVERSVEEYELIRQNKMKRVQKIDVDHARSNGSKLNDAEWGRRR